MKKIIPVLLAFFAIHLHARTINVADHGIVPGIDATYQLNRLVESIQDEPGVTLEFPQGTYSFSYENAVETYRAVSNHDNGLKRMAFPLFNNRDITIEGNGSLFLFNGFIVPFTLESVDGAALRNFTIDFERSFHAEMTVVESNPKDKSFVVEMDPEKYPYSINKGEITFHRYEIDHPIGSNMLWDPKTRAPIYRTKDYAIRGPQAVVTAISPGRFKFEKAVKVAPPVGTILVAYGSHPTSRLCHAIQVANSQDIVLENVTIHDAGGMGLIVERTENVTLNHYVVTSGKDRYVSTRADATHFIGCKGTIKLEGCVLEHMLDDGINVHGAYVKVVDYMGKNQFLCEISHFQQWGLVFAEPGDEIALLSRETILPFYKTSVTDVRILNEHRFVMTVAEMPDKLPEGPLSVENLTWYPDLVMRNNVIRENRARSVLVTTKGKVLIENNVFASQMHGILIEGDNNFWYESGAVEDVVIRNNVFENIGFAVDGRYPLLASPLFRPEQRMGEGQYHRNIHFINNTIRSFNGHLVKARSVGDLEISGNKMVFSTDYPKAVEGPAIDLTYCDNVRIMDNTAVGFDWELEMAISEDTTRVKSRNNIGFEKNP